jgi:hypothetical protein
VYIALANLRALCLVGDQEGCFRKNSRVCMHSSHMPWGNWVITEEAWVCQCCALFPHLRRAIFL